MTNKPSISCIIPAYNEGTRILDVLKVVIGHPLIDEIIVVNDGSTDNTDSLLKKMNGIQLVSYLQNRGKSHAVMVGIKKAKNDLILMIDADLVGLKQSDITALIEPVINNDADTTLSLRKNSLRIYKLFGLDYISGERVFKKDIIENLDELDQIFGFGLESFLNKIIVQKKLRLKVVYLRNVSQTIKARKTGFWKGMKGELVVAQKIISYLGFFGAIKVYVQMLKLRV